MLRRGPGIANSNGGKVSTWVCLCDCGEESTVRGHNLNSRETGTQSCGKCERPHVVNEIGNVYGRLTVIDRVAHKSKSGYAFWRCICSCGKETIVRGHSLRAGHHKSCGCLAKDTARALKTIHGLCAHPLYAIWSSIKDRCLNPRSKAYKYYGGRGISVHKIWINDPERFIRDIESLLGPKPFPNMSLDRIDVDKDYAPGNLRWATPDQQSRNKQCEFRVPPEIYKWLKDNGFI